MLSSTAWVSSATSTSLHISLDERVYVSTVGRAVNWDHDILRKINELVIEAAHLGIPEDDIMRAVDDGLTLVLGPLEEDDNQTEQE